MSDPTTTHYGLSKSVVGSDSDTWGTTLNADMDLIDTAIFGVASTTSTVSTSLSSTNSSVTSLSTALTSSLSSTNSNVANHTASLSQISSSLSSTNLTVAGHTTSLSAISSSLSSTNTTVANVSTSLTGVSSSLSSAISVNTGQSTSLSQVSSSLANVNTSLANVSTSLAALPQAGTAPTNAGLRGVALNHENAAYTLVQADNGGCVYNDSGSPETYTVPSLTAGTIIMVCAQSGTINLSVSGVTLEWAGTSSTGNRTLTAFGLASLVWVTSTLVMVSGAGLS